MRFVLPRVEFEEARRILSRRKRLWPRRKREMKGLELVYLPYYVYRVAVSQGDEEHEVLVCTDGIRSVFSFFDEKEVAFGDEARAAVFDFLVSEGEAKRACLENLRWHLVRQALRLKVRARVKEVREVERIHYPYWVGYLKGRGGYDFVAADAVTGEVQGVRMRDVFLTAFSRHGMDDTGMVTSQDSPQPARRCEPHARRADLPLSRTDTKPAERPGSARRAQR